MHLKSFNLSTQGKSHIAKNKECQDASCCYYDENFALAIVCDGHGGDDYVRSAFGSKFACEVAELNIKNFVKNVDKDYLKRHSDTLIGNLEGSIISGWNEAVYSHYEQNPFLENEIAVLSEKAKRKYLQEQRIESAYGTTLIAVVVTREYWFGIHIGDGKCVAISPEGKFVQPIPWDDKCFLNATTSICDSKALSNFRHFYSEKLPLAVFVGSDGIDDCFSNAQQLNNLYKTVLYSFTTSDFDTAISDLSDYLPRLSSKGSGDDVSIAAVLDLDRIGEIESVKEFDREKEKARVEESIRIEAEKALAERKRVEEERAQQAAEMAKRRQAEEARRAKPVPPPIRRCAVCGEALIPNMNFCGECGTRIGAQGDNAAPVKQDGADGVTVIKTVPFNSGVAAGKKADDDAFEAAQAIPEAAPKEATTNTAEELPMVTADADAEMSLQESAETSAFEQAVITPVEEAAFAGNNGTTGTVMPENESFEIPSDSMKPDGKESDGTDAISE